MTKDVTLGRATIPWAGKCFPLLDSIYPNGYRPPRGLIEAGWVLPGGTRTTNREEAVMAAQIIDNLMEQSK